MRESWVGEESDRRKMMVKIKVMEMRIMGS